MGNCKLLLFDLDGTLLGSDKRISKRTLKVLLECRKKGILISVSTSRGEQNVLPYVEEVQPDILIASGGAVAKYYNEYIYKAEFSKEETRQMIAAARKICGKGVAMGNAIEAVKEKADLVIGSNDEDGIARYLEESVLL